MLKLYLSVAYGYIEAGTWIAKSGYRTRCRVGKRQTTLKEEMMNGDRIEGNWKEMKGKIQQQWGKLTDNDLEQIDGRKTELVGKLQKNYGKSKEEAEREVDRYFN